MAGVYSRTYPLSMPPAQADGDSLYSAWIALSEARELSFDRSSPAVWRERFNLLARAAARGVAEHTARVGGCQAAAAHHADLARQAANLLGACTEAATAGVRGVIELNELAIHVEIAIARHQNRLRAALSVLAPAEAMQPASIAS